MAPAIIGIVLWAIGLYIFYMIIISAINNSNAVRLLAEIRDMLKKQELERKAVNIPESDISDSEESG